MTDLKGLVAMARVTDVERSIAFYEQLGFAVKSTFEEGGVLGWAYLAQGGAHLMLTLGRPGTDGGPSQVYLYVDDARAYHAELSEKGLEVSPVVERFYMERGEFELHDPDGNLLLVGHT